VELIEDGASLCRGTTLLFGLFTACYAVQGTQTPFHFKLYLFHAQEMYKNEVMTSFMPFIPVFNRV
jgi:hypothetical protein